MSEQVTTSKQIRTSGAVSLNRIKMIQKSLREAEKRAAEYIFAHPEDVIRLSITELADRSQVSEATIMRMCRKTGFKGFQDLKISIAQDLVAPLQNIHESIGPEDDIPTLINKVFSSNVESLEQTKGIIDAAEVSKAVEAICKAQCTDIYAVGTSAPVAMDFSYKLVRLRVANRLYLDTHMQAIAAAALRPGAVAVGISHSGSSRDIVDAMSLAKEAGATTVAITHFGKSPLTAVADIKLYTMARETDYRPEALASRLAQMSVIDLLYVAIALHKWEERVEALRLADKAVTGKKY